MTGAQVPPGEEAAGEGVMVTVADEGVEAAGAVDSSTGADG